MKTICKEISTGRHCLSVAVWLLFFLNVSFVARPINDVTVKLYDQRGMVAGNYSAFCQDSEGFLWIGTDSGLLCFDGNRFDIYRNDELDPHSISDNKIVSLYNDDSGIVWVGTVDGLNCYDREFDSFRLVKLPEKLLNGFIRDVVTLPDGRLLFLVSGIGMYTLDKESIINQDTDLVARRFKIGFKDDNTISRLIGIGRQGVVFSTPTGDIYLLDPNNPNKVVLIAKTGGNIFKILSEDQDNLIVATQYEAFRLNVRTRTVEALGIDGKEPVKITDIHSKDGMTYFSTAGTGMWMLKAGENLIQRAKWLHSSTFDLSTLMIGSVFKDSFGNLWFGCNHKGVAIAPSGQGAFADKSLNDILQKEGGAEITCMEVVGEEIALGLNNGTVILLDKSGGVRKAEVARGCQITSMSAYGKGHLVVGVARNGIWNLDIDSMHLSKIISPASSYPGVVLSVDEKGDIVAAFGGLGVLRYDAATHSEKWFYPVSGSNLLSCSYYAGISSTSDRKVWIGGYSGIACYDKKADGLIPISQEPFYKGVVNDICDYGDGIMIATDRGLIYYTKEGGIVRKFTTLDGLPDNDVRTLELDGKGGVWLGTMKGLAYVSDLEGRIHKYGGNTGLGRRGYVFSGSLPSDGRIVMGNFEGLTFFNPDSVKQSTFGGGVRISGLYLNGEKITSKSSVGSTPIVEGSRMRPDVIHLSHIDNSLVVRLSTLDFRDNSDVRYEWQLDDEKDVWHTTSPGEFLVYLPPLGSGRHSVRLRGWDNDVVSDVTELNISVKAPWYLSNMAYASYVIIALMMGGLVYKVLKNKRDEELYEQRIKYFMDISHELRSPVTLMLSPVETLLKQEHSPETTSQLLTVRRNAQRVLNLVNQLLDLRKIEKGKMRLVFEPVDIKDFIEELVEMFRPMAEEKGLSISFETENKELWGEVDRNNLDKILVNLISNAIKYTPEGGEIKICLSTSTGDFGSLSYSITVIDTGIGLDNKVISHLFERFYRNREHHHGSASGFGIGLDLCMRLVQLHKGDIVAKNREDGVRGSIFSVTLPLIPTKPVKGGDNGYSHKEEPKRILLPDVVSGSKTKTKDRARSSHGFRILVVDDDSELREYIKHSLGASYKIVVAADAEEALREIGERVPDLIITDVRMDGIDGFEFLRRVKGNMLSHHVPVIIFSSAYGTEERTKAWRCGADGYLAKPFSIEELDGMIVGLLTNRSKLKGKFSGNQEYVEHIEVPKIKGVDEELMTKVNRYINDNLSESTMNVDNLSEYVGLSRSQLHRRMKEIVGAAPSDYIRNVKLRKACEMLAQGDVDIAQVAYSLGFNAQSHFSTLFKRYTGMTPSEYRNTEKNKYDISAEKQDGMGEYA